MLILRKGKIKCCLLFRPKKNKIKALSISQKNLLNINCIQVEQVTHKFIIVYIKVLIIMEVYIVLNELLYEFITIYKNIIYI